MVVSAARDLDVSLQQLGHRSATVRQGAARRVRLFYERAGSALEILRRLSEALGSNDPARRHGGLALVNELVDVNEWSRVGTGAARFCRLLRAVLERSTASGTARKAHRRSVCRTQPHGPL